MEIVDLNPWPAILAKQRRIEENVQFALVAASAAYAAKLWRKGNWEMYDLTKKSLSWALWKGLISHHSPHHVDFIEFIDLFLRDGQDSKTSDREVFLEPSEPRISSLVTKAAAALTIESQKFVYRPALDLSAPFTSDSIHRTVGEWQSSSVETANFGTSNSR